MGSEMKRREFLLSTAAAAALLRTRAAGAAGPGYGEKRYSKAMVIDGLGGPGGFHPELPDDAPWTESDVADARLSGVTAVNCTINEVGNAPDRFEKTIRYIALIERELAAHPDVFMKILRGSDLAAARDSRRMGLIFGCQDTSMLEGDLGRLTLFHGLGVRIAQPTYNLRNLMGDGCLEEADGGLSRLGHDFVSEVNRLRIVLDLSHAGRKVISQGIQASKAPMAITHTGCRALVDLPRNTDDVSLRALADRGGVAGIYFMPFLRASGQPHAEDVIRHLEHAVNVCGEDHVGLGTDGNISRVEIDDAFREFMRKSVEARRKAGISAPGESADVVNLIPEYNEPRRFLKLADDLAKRGWPDTRIEKILGANFARLFAEVWG
jgi:membrane dipeptidase